MIYVRKLWLRRKLDRLLDRILSARQSGEDLKWLQCEAYTVLTEIVAMDMKVR